MAIPTAYGEIGLSDNYVYYRHILCSCNNTITIRTLVCSNGV